MTAVFDLVVVGSGGGPDETNLSAYLFKLSDASWEDGIIALEAGSSQGALRRLLSNDPELFDHGTMDNREGNTTTDKKAYTANEIYSLVCSYLITHAHMDHINGLVLSAGSLTGPRKTVYATQQVLQDIEIAFSGRLWPNLASWNDSDDEYKLLYKLYDPLLFSLSRCTYNDLTLLDHLAPSLDSDGKYHTIHPNISVRSFRLSHGKNDDDHYWSSAFFIRHDPSSREFIFFGDVEPDSVATCPQTIHVWRAAASKIPDTLDTIFIECSWPSGRTDEMLFGHLTPEHLLDELVALAKEIITYRKKRTHQDSESGDEPARKRLKPNAITVEELHGALEGLRVYIVHCKDDMKGLEEASSRELITQQVKDLVLSLKLGVVIECAEPGMRLSI